MNLLKREQHFLKASDLVMNNSFDDYLKTDIVISLASVLMVTSVMGFGVYIWYLSTSEDNTSRLLNNLYGHLAGMGSLGSLFLWAKVVMLTKFTAEDGLACVIDTVDHTIALLFMASISLCGVAIPARTPTMRCSPCSQR